MLSLFIKMQGLEKQRRDKAKGGLVRMRGNKIVTLIFLLFLMLNISVNKIVLATGKNFTVSNKWNIVQLEYNMPGWILVLTSNGDVYGWGDNEFGFLGQGDKHDRSTPNLIKDRSQILKIILLNLYICGSGSIPF